MTRLHPLCLLLVSALLLQPVRMLGAKPAPDEADYQALLGAARGKRVEVVYRAPEGGKTLEAEGRIEGSEGGPAGAAAAG